VHASANAATLDQRRQLLLEQLIFQWRAERRTDASSPELPCFQGHHARRMDEQIACGTAIAAEALAWMLHSAA
jgi:hypothetical protein